MTASAQKSYLATGIVTAPPQRLQLMLIEGAIRFSEQARRHWQDGKDQEARSDLIRAQEIVVELLAGLKPDVDPKLVGKVASVYLFIYRRLLEASLQRSQQKLDEACRVLEVERRTWCQVCQALDQALDDGACRPDPAAARVSNCSNSEDRPAGGLSLEA
ncbi:MAG TPA: flagellar protein FliS [Planctomycetaceae bacterium]|nr:flagellar protein FliS [Planctomycetaceae bacterium]HIQ22342.1 flagellar protein FliS [Planctomycetota bacterium]